MFIPTHSTFEEKRSKAESNNYTPQDECRKLQDELRAERLRAAKLVDDFNEQLNECMRIQKWRIVLALLLILAVIVAWVYVGKYDTIQSKYDAIQSEYDFYHNGAAIVTEDGNYYHRYNCDKVTADSYWIYNTEYAEWLGYEPCKYCWDE